MAPPTEQYPSTFACEVSFHPVSSRSNPAARHNLQAVTHSISTHHSLITRWEWKTYEKSFVAIVGTLPPILIRELYILDNRAIGECKFVLFCRLVVIECQCGVALALGRLRNGSSSRFRRWRSGRFLLVRTTLDQFHVVAGEEAFLALGVGSTPPVLFLLVG